MPHPPRDADGVDNTYPYLSNAEATLDAAFRGSVSYDEEHQSRDDRPINLYLYAPMFKLSFFCFSSTLAVEELFRAHVHRCLSCPLHLFLHVFRVA